jgi:hypothetical protein
LGPRLEGARGPLLPRPTPGRPPRPPPKRPHRKANRSTWPLVCVNSSDATLTRPASPNWPCMKSRLLVCGGGGTNGRRGSGLGAVGHRGGAGAGARWRSRAVPGRARAAHAGRTPRPSGRRAARTCPPTPSPCGRSTQSPGGGGCGGGQGRAVTHGAARVGRHALAWARSAQRRKLTPPRRVADPHPMAHATPRARVPIQTHL